MIHTDTIERKGHIASDDFLSIFSDRRLLVEMNFPLTCRGSDVTRETSRVALPDGSNGLLS